MPRPLKFTPERKELFLQALREGKSIPEACKAAVVSVGTAYDHKRDEADFRREWELAYEIGGDVIESEALRRALEGDPEPVIGKVAPGIDGHVVGPDGRPMYIQRKSDRLLEIALKGRRTQYKDNPRIDIKNQTLAISVEDKSANLAEVWRILREAGSDVIEGEVIEEVDGEAAILSSGGAGKALPAAEGLLAQPALVQREAGGVPADKES